MRGQRRKTLHDCRHARLLRLVELGARAHEILVHESENARLLVVQRLAACLHGVDATEEIGVHVDRSVMRGELRRHFALDRLQRFVRVRGREVPEHAANLAQERARALKRLDRIGEGCGRGVGCDGRDILPVRLKARLERRREMFRRDALERRQAEGRGPGLEKRIGGHAVLTKTEAARYWRTPPRSV